LRANEKQKAPELEQRSQFDLLYAGCREKYFREKQAMLQEWNVDLRNLTDQS
jgi:hypothetical protein